MDASRTRGRGPTHPPHLPPLASNEKQEAPPRGHGPGCRGPNLGRSPALPCPSAGKRSLQGWSGVCPSSALPSPQLQGVRAHARTGGLCARASGVCWEVCPQVGRVQWFRLGEKTAEAVPIAKQ